MKDNFKRLSTILEGKAVSLVDAIEKADPTTPEYKELMINFDVTMAVNGNIQNTLAQEEMMAMQMQANPNVQVNEQETNLKEGE